MQVKVQKQHKSIDKLKLKERKRLMNKKKGLIKQVTRFKMHKSGKFWVISSLTHFSWLNLSKKSAQQVKAEIKETSYQLLYGEEDEATHKTRFGSGLKALTGLVAGLGLGAGMSQGQTYAETTQPSVEKQSGKETLAQKDSVAIKLETSDSETNTSSASESQSQSQSLSTSESNSDLASEAQVLQGPVQRAAYDDGQVTENQIYDVNYKGYYYQSSKGTDPSKYDGLMKVQMNKDNVTVQFDPSKPLPKSVAVKLKSEADPSVPQQNVLNLTLGKKVTSYTTQISYDGDLSTYWTNYIRKHPEWADTNPAIQIVVNDGHWIANENGWTTVSRYEIPVISDSSSTSESVSGSESISQSEIVSDSDSKSDSKSLSDSSFESQSDSESISNSESVSESLSETLSESSSESTSASHSISSSESLSETLSA